MTLSPSVHLRLCNYSCFKMCLSVFACLFLCLQHIILAERKTCHLFKCLSIDLLFHFSDITPSTSTPGILSFLFSEDEMENTLCSLSSCEALPVCEVNIPTSLTSLFYVRYLEILFYRLLISDFIENVDRLFKT